MWVQAQTPNPLGQGAREEDPFHIFCALTGPASFSTLPFNLYL